MNITDNTVFIAGATSGIGLGLGLRFQAAGNQVIIGGHGAVLCLTRSPPTTQASTL